MLTFYNNNKINIEKININYRKLKIREFIINSNFIIFCNLNDVLFLKNKLLSENIPSLTLKKKYIKALFQQPNFSFLEGEGFFCIFIKNVEKFLDIINNLENKEFSYSYKNSLSNYSSTYKIIQEYKKYNKNYVFLQFFFFKKKLKIIILLYFFSTSLIRFIK